MFVFHCGISIILFLTFECNTLTIHRETLQLVTAMFRHGDRTNDLGTTYPTDPHINETYEPYGVGELTNDGKEKEYELGQLLRERYIQFLGELYKNEKINAVTTNYSRTKMSLQLVLAGLYPPNLTPLRWNKSLNWIPIPYDYISSSSNRLLTLPIASCPRYKQAYYAYKQTIEGQNIESSFNSWYPYISNHSGLNVTEILNIFFLYFGLTSEREWGLKLPQWTRKVYPDYLTKAAIQNYELFVANEQLNQLHGGFLLKKIIADMTAKINGGSRNLKMYLYSGHEININGLLGAMDMFFPHVPPYGACILIELHKINGSHFVKVLYQDYSSINLREMTVPGCSFVCPIAQFISLLTKNLPNEENGDPCII